MCSGQSSASPMKKGAIACRLAINNLVSGKKKVRTIHTRIGSGNRTMDSAQNIDLKKYEELVGGEYKYVDRQLHLDSQQRKQLTYLDQFTQTHHTNNSSCASLSSSSPASLRRFPSLLHSNRGHLLLTSILHAHSFTV